MNKVDRRQQRQIRDLKDSAVVMRQGVITDDSPLTVSISGGTDVIGVKSLGGYEPDVGTRVNVAMWGRDALILGPSTSTPSLAGGVELGYAQITSNATQTGAGNNDVSGLSVSVTVGVRPILVRFEASSAFNSSGSGITIISIKESSTVLSTVSVSSTTLALPVRREVRLAPSAGSHTYKINLQQFVSGNSTLSAGSTDPAFIQVIEV